MNEAGRTAHMQRVRGFVTAFGLIGLALVLLLAIGRQQTFPETGGYEIFVLLASPFLLALLSLRLPRIAQQRWAWLACALLTALIGIPLIFNGVGFFLLALAVGFAWAFVKTRG